MAKIIMTRRELKEIIKEVVSEVFEEEANRILLLEQWDEETKKTLWDKCEIISGKDSNEFRRDSKKNVIRWSHYGKRASEFGWEVDHIEPGENDDLSNLQCLQWRENVLKSDNPDEDIEINL